MVRDGASPASFIWSCAFVRIFDSIDLSCDCEIEHAVPAQDQIRNPRYRYVNFALTDWRYDRQVIHARWAAFQDQRLIRTILASVSRPNSLK
jgi:hypothetical protein